MRLKQLKTYEYLPNVRFPWSAFVLFGEGEASVCVKINETKDFLCQQTISCQALTESEGNVKLDVENINLDFFMKAHELLALIRVHPHSQVLNPLRTYRAWRNENN